MARLTTACSGRLPFASPEDPPLYRNVRPHGMKSHDQNTRITRTYAIPRGGNRKQRQPWCRLTGGGSCRPRSCSFCRPSWRRSAKCRRGWGLALAGIVHTVVGGVRYPRLSTGLYLAMGWLILIAVKPLWLRVPSWGLFWLSAGGVAYTGGGGFFVATGGLFR